MAKRPSPAYDARERDDDTGRPARDLVGFGMPEYASTMTLLLSVAVAAIADIERRLPDAAGDAIAAVCG